MVWDEADENNATIGDLEHPAISAFWNILILVGSNSFF
jgi:hypothetical protein